MKEDVRKACTAWCHQAHKGLSEVLLCSETALGPCSHTVQQIINHKFPTVTLINHNRSRRAFSQNNYMASKFVYIPYHSLTISMARAAGSPNSMVAVFISGRITSFQISHVD
jgi:hypothetical protein